MGRFKNIKITYNCDLQEQSLEKVFYDWQPHPEFFELKKQYKAWAKGNPYHLIERVSKTHLRIQRQGQYRWLNAIIDVEYNQEQKILNLQIATPQKAYLYLLLPVLYFLLMRKEMLAVQENGPGFLIGFVIGILVLLGIIFLIPISDKGDLQKSVEEQLGLARIRFSQLTK